MTGRVIIVTGANSGIGYETAKFLCDGGNEVILACRNEEKGKAAVGKILESNPNALASFIQLDLADLASVRKFVDDFHTSGRKLNVLVNNAGVYLDKRMPRQYTKDNFEMTIGTNHLGHFLLTNLLLDDLKKTGTEAGDSRIVVVTSALHDRNIKTLRKNKYVTSFDIEDIFLIGEGKYSADNAYKNAKLANVLFTYEMAKRLEETGVSANCVCPGFVPASNLSRHASGSSRFFIRYVLGGLFRFTKMTRTVEQGARMVVEVATDEKLKGVNGKYFRDHAEAVSSDESLDEELRVKLWELSAQYCHMEGYEPLDAPEPKKEEPEVKAVEAEGESVMAETQKEAKSEEKGEKEEKEEKMETVEEEKSEKIEEIEEKSEKIEDTENTEKKEETIEVKEDVEKPVKEEIDIEIKKEDVSDEKVIDEKKVDIEIQPAPEVVQ